MKKIYTYYSESLPDIKLAELIINETLIEETGHIIIYNKEYTPGLVQLAESMSNNILGVKECLLDRVTPSNRMFFAEYCKSLGLNPESIDDRLKISEGRTWNDDCYIKVEVIND